MYNEELENLIDAALEDGVLTDKERMVLMKRASAMGIDADEFEMVLDARLVKKQKADVAAAAQAAAQIAASQQAVQPRNVRAGNIVKCPNCGAEINGAIGKCPECGMLLNNIEGNSSTQRLSDKLAEVDQNSSSNPLRIYTQMFGVDKTTNTKKTIIQTFPVPTTKQDLAEFITFCYSNYRSFKGKFSGGTPSDQQLSVAWQAKMRECINKANVFFPDDEDLKRVILSVGGKVVNPTAPKKGLFGKLFGK